MLKKKNSNPSIKKDLFAKGRWMAREMVRQAEKQLTQEEAEDRAAQLINWALRDTTALSRNPFYREIGIAESTFITQCQRYPILGYANEVVKGIIADRMYKGASHIDPEQKLTSDVLRNFRYFSTDAQKIKEMEIQDEVKKIKEKASAEAQASGKRNPEGNYDQDQFKSELDELGEQSNPKQDNPTPLSKDINK